MEKGKFFLTYITFDSMENHIGNARVEKRIDLRAENEDQAILFAQRLCPKLETFKGWDGSFYPREPRVIYEVPFKRE